MLRVLLVQGERSPLPELEEALGQRGCEVTRVGSMEEAFPFIEQFWDTILVDGCGKQEAVAEFCQLAWEKGGHDLPIIAMFNTGENTTVDNVTTLQLPFTWRKVLNRIHKLTQAREASLIRMGPLILNVAERIIFCNHQPFHLTPKQCQLLKVLMEHSGEVLSRKQLMQMVWDTDYTGDTRTLDVHIHWLRQRIEEDAHHPRYLRTVRGVGYRFEIPEGE